MDAETRRQRFLAEKARAGGAEALEAERKSQRPTVYFNSYGDIVSFGVATIDPKDGWITYDFGDLFPEHINEDNYHTFYVVEVDENEYEIKAKEDDSANWYQSSNNTFMYEIEQQFKADLMVTVASDNITFDLSGTIKSELTDGESDIVKRYKHHDQTVFYITAHKDPHVLKRIEVVTINDLSLGPVVRPIIPGVDMSECSIYTKKIFNSYGLINDTN